MVWEDIGEGGSGNCLLDSFCAGGFGRMVYFSLSYDFRVSLSNSRWWNTNLRELPTVGAFINDGSAFSVDDNSFVDGDGDGDGADGFLFPIEEVVSYLVVYITKL